MSACSPPKVKFVFVRTCEEDTTFLTGNLPAEVTRANYIEELKRDRADAIILDSAVASPEQISSLKKSHDTAVFVLSRPETLSHAIDQVKNGADGFLVKGISTTGVR